MNPDPRELFEYIGGLPFVDVGFHAPRLATAVACLRRNIDPAAFPELRDYLVPGNARWLYGKYTNCSLTEFPCRHLSPSEEGQVHEATADVLQVCPWWSKLFAVPKEYLKLVGDEIVSVTNVLVPQTIYLGDPAFLSRDILVETLIHEHAHVWLAFIAELKDFERPDSRPEYILPSGTKGKTIRGVLLAAHFATAVITFHRSGIETKTPSGNPKRMGELERYLTGCVETATGQPDLTEMGSLVLERLHAACQVPIHPLG
jgi:hypothetical protein